MAKNSQNKLKFGPDMYFYGFHQILEESWKIFKIGKILLKIEPFFTWTKRGLKMAIIYPKMIQMS